MISSYNSQLHGQPQAVSCFRRFGCTKNTITCQVSFKPVLKSPPARVCIDIGMLFRFSDNKRLLCFLLRNLALSQLLNTFPPVLLTLPAACNDMCGTKAVAKPICVSCGLALYILAIWVYWSFCVHHLSKIWWDGTGSFMNWKKREKSKPKVSRLQTTEHEVSCLECSS